MAWIAIRMLTASRGKFVGLIAGLAFASLLIAQQSAIFCGVMMSAAGEIRDIVHCDLWVMDPSVQHIGPVKALHDADLQRVRSVRGVEWAVPYYEGEALAELEGGQVQQVILHGIDDESLAGATREMILGDVKNLDAPEAVLIDLAGYRKLWPGEELQLGRPLTLNQQHVVVQGVCRANPVLRTLPIVYSRISQIGGMTPPGIDITSFILVKAKPGTAIDELKETMAAATGQLVLTSEQFQWKTIRYVLEHTGIPLNFAVTVALGFLVGVLISGQTLYLVTLENLPFFGILKALGTTNRQIVGMILLQSLIAGAIGLGFGVGTASLFGELAGRLPKLLFYMPWQVVVGTGMSIMTIVMLGSLLSISRVLVLEPAVVFRR